MAKTKKTAAATRATRPVAAAPRGRADARKVRALQIGYYGEKRRRVGDVFVLADAKDFSSKWMERVDAQTPERATTGQEAIRQEHDAILAARVKGVADALPPTGEDSVLGDDDRGGD